MTLTLSKPTRLHYLGSALVLAAGFALVAAYRGLGSWLVVETPMPPRVDVIFTFGGENVRDTYSRQLADMHPEAVWILSTYSSSVEARALMRDEFDTSRVVLVDSLRNTWEELRYLRGWINTHRAELTAKANRAAQAASSPADSSITQDSTIRNPKSQIIHASLVSGPYHMRRIKVGAVRLLNDKTIRLYYTPVPFAAYNQSAAGYRHWWKEPSLARLVRLEFVKVLYYLVRA